MNLGAIELHDGKIMIACPWEREFTDTIKGIAKDCNVSISYTNRLWVLPFRADIANAVKRSFGERFKIGQSFEAALPPKIEPVTFNAGGMKFDLMAPLPGGKTLYGYQQEEIVKMIERRFIILAMDMGTGKTICALIASKIIYDNYKIRTVVIAPANLISNWREEAEAVGHRVVSFHSWAKQPDKIQSNYCLIVDEAHFAQNPTAKRTKKFHTLAAEAEAVFPLTGTPMKNGQPKNLFSLLKAVRHPLGDDQRHFEMRYCRGQYQAMGGGWIKNNVLHWKCKSCCDTASTSSFHWKKKIYNCPVCGTPSGPITLFWAATGAENLDELRAAIAPVIIRRRKEDCLDLPERRIIKRTMEVSKEMQEAYDTALEDCQSNYQRRIAEGSISDEAEALALLMFIRKAASLAKVEVSIELIEEAIEQGNPPLVFAEFIGTANAIAKHFKVHPYTGETRVDKSQIVRDFMEAKTPVFVATGAAGGVGLNLTRASEVFLIDRPLTPGDADQYVDRAHRIGQKNHVTGYWLQAFPVCKKIDSILERKTGIIGHVIDGTKNTVRGTGGIRATEVLRDLFSKE